jgi:prepilin-type N-terminal cleavage/methylation domain-containing protein
MNLARVRQSRAFSLIELVIVVVIIGIIAAIAVPRMSRGAAGASDSALSANLSVLRNAIDLFQTEHGGTFPSLANLPNALIQYSDAAGTTFSATKTASCIYGPYLRSIPALPVGADKGATSFVATYTAGNGWVYSAATGSVTANCAPAEVDARGVAYNSY